MRNSLRCLTFCFGIRRVDNGKKIISLVGNWVKDKVEVKGESKDKGEKS